MEATLRTSRSSPIVGCLRFGGSAHSGGGDFKCLATVEADDQTYAVELEMIHPYRRDMLGFFEDIGRTARQGWDGVEAWESESSELRIEAASSGDGEVRMDVRMLWPPNYDDRWHGTLVMTADAVENFAQRMREFLGLEHGSRFRPVPRKS